MLYYGSDIELFKGMSRVFTIVREVNGVETAFVGGDVLEFSVKADYADTDYQVFKQVTVFSEGKAVLEIAPEDTVDMEAPKDYIYDLVLTTGNKKYPLILPSRLILHPMVNTGAPE